MNDVAGNLISVGDNVWVSESFSCKLKSGVVEDIRDAGFTIIVVYSHRGQKQIKPFATSRVILDQSKRIEELEQIESYYYSRSWLDANDKLDTEVVGDFYKYSQNEEVDE